MKDSAVSESILTTPYYDNISSSSVLHASKHYVYSESECAEHWYSYSGHSKILSAI